MKQSKPKSGDHRICSVARTLDILGDRWIFLVLREAFFGVRYYEEIRTNLGIATNILSDRLKILVDNGIMEKRADDLDARRIQYRLTEKGLDIYPIVLALMNWGDKWLSDERGEPLRLRHETCGSRLEAEMRCGHCGEPVRPRDVTYKSVARPGDKT